MKSIDIATNVHFEVKFRQNWKGKKVKSSPKNDRRDFIIGVVFTIIDIIEIAANVAQKPEWYGWLPVIPFSLIAVAAFIKSAGIVKVKELDFMRVTDETIYFHLDPEMRHDSKMLRQVFRSIFSVDPIQKINILDIVKMERQLHDLVFFLKNGKKTKLHIWHLSSELKLEVQDNLKEICEERNIPVSDSALFQRDREKKMQKLLNNGE